MHAVASPALLLTRRPPAAVPTPPPDHPGPPPAIATRPPRIGTLRANCQRLSNKVTKAIAIAAGESFPFWYVSEYPKAGGTWLSNLLADYLAIPFPKFSALPLACQCIVHNHWRWHPRLNRVFYLYRDGRDVLVSYYFMRMRMIAQPANAYERKMRRRYVRLFGRGFDPEHTAATLPRFIELEMTRPLQARINWPDHISEWYDPARRNIAYLSYEELLTSPVPTLERCLERFLDEPVDRARLAESVDRWSFSRLSGRTPGTEDRNDFLRKGIAGDWRNHFTRDACEVFDRYAGQALLALGYETRPDWVARTFGSR